MCYPEEAEGMGTVSVDIFSGANPSGNCGVRQGMNCQAKFLTFIDFVGLRKGATSVVAFLELIPCHDIGKREKTAQKRFCETVLLRLSIFTL